MKRILLFTAFIVLHLQNQSFAQTKTAPAQNNVQPPNNIQPQTPALSDLEPAFNQTLNDWQGAGFAVAVVHKGKLVYKKGFGYRDYERKLPVTENTLFAIGSCTKAFTASLIGILNKEGKVSLDEPVTTYLPGFNFYNPDMDRTVTLRNMMDHTTGLPRHDYSWYIFSTASRDSLVKRIKYLQPYAPVGAHWQYNNFMYALQGYLVEKITGKSWEDNIREKFFQPLGMNASNFDSAGLQTSSNAAVGYTLGNGDAPQKTNYHNIAAMAPAGSINSNAEDMSKWLITWMNRGRYLDKQILPTSHYFEAISSQSIMHPGLPNKEKPDLFFANYGLAWMLSNYRGHYRVEHAGNIDGFSANVCFFPADSLGIVVLTNQDNSQIQNIVRNLIADKLLQLPGIDWNKDLKKMMIKPPPPIKKDVAVTTPAHPPADYQGSFFHAGYGTIQVKLANDSLFAQTGNYTWWLKHENFDVFKLIGKEEGKPYDASTAGAALAIQFMPDVNGSINSCAVRFEPQLQPLVFNRKTK